MPGEPGTSGRREPTLLHAGTVELGRLPSQGPRSARPKTKRAAAGFFDEKRAIGPGQTRPTAYPASFRPSFPALGTSHLAPNALISKRVPSLSPGLSQKNNLVGRGWWHRTFEPQEPGSTLVVKRSCLIVDRRSQGGRRWVLPPRSQANGLPSREPLALHAHQPQAMLGQGTLAKLGSILWLF